jgi:hypothetical protein
VISFLQFCQHLQLSNEHNVFPNFPADITPTQFIMIDGKYKVNDFNRCRFMRVNTTDNSECGFNVGMNPGKVCDELTACRLDLCS